MRKRRSKELAYVEEKGKKHMDEEQCDEGETDEGKSYTCQLKTFRDRDRNRFSTLKNLWALEKIRGVLWIELFQQSAVFNLPTFMIIRCNSTSVTSRACLTHLSMSLAVQYVLLCVPLGDFSSERRKSMIYFGWQEHGWYNREVLDRSKDQRQRRTGQNSSWPQETARSWKWNLTGTNAINLQGSCVERRQHAAVVL